MPSQTNPADRVLPLIPLRDVVVFPHMVIPLFVGRDKSIAALEEAMTADRDILLAAQKEARVNEPGPDDIHAVGTVGTIIQLLKLPDGTVKVLVEGGERALIDRINVSDHFSAEITMLSEDDRHDEREIELRAANESIVEFEQWMELGSHGGGGRRRHVLGPQFCL